MRIAIAGLPGVAAVLFVIAGLATLAWSPGTATAADGCVAPVNDDISNAMVVPGVPFEHLVDTTCATPAASDPDCFGRGATVWYSFTPDKDYDLWVNTVRSDYDTTLSVHRQDGAGLTRIVCEDDAQFGFPAVVEINVQARQRYYVMVGSSNDGPGGNLDLQIYVRQKLAIEIERKGSVEEGSGSAVITGTLICARPTEVMIDVRLTQRVGDNNISGYAMLDVPCDGEAPWSAVVSGCCGGAFVKGRVQVSASGFVGDTGGFAIADAAETVRLKKSKS